MTTAIAVPTFAAVGTGTTATGAGIEVGVFTAVGAAFISIEKAATDAALNASGIVDTDFDFASTAFANGCQVLKPK